MPSDYSGNAAFLRSLTDGLTPDPLMTVAEWADSYGPFLEALLQSTAMRFHGKRVRLDRMPADWAECDRGRIGQVLEGARGHRAHAQGDQGQAQRGLHVSLLGAERGVGEGINSDGRDGNRASRAPPGRGN